MAKPIPAPRKNPPKTATNSLSLVIIGKSTNVKQSDNPKIAKVVFTANCIPMVRYPIITNGILMKTISIDKGKSVMNETNNEIPVAPPSINLLVNKKPLNPKEAENIPNAIRKKSRK